MRRKIAFLISILLPLMVSFTVLAEGIDDITWADGFALLENGATYGKNIYFDTNETVASIYDVTVEYNDLDFTYVVTGGKLTWDPSTHTYDASSIRCECIEERDVKVSNHSNNKVTVDAEFEGNEGNKVIPTIKRDGTSISSLPETIRAKTLKAATESTYYGDYSKADSVTYTVLFEQCEEGYDFPMPDFSSGSFKGESEIGSLNILIKQNDESLFSDSDNTNELSAADDVKVMCCFDTTSVDKEYLEAAYFHLDFKDYVARWNPSNHNYDVDDNFFEDRTSNTIYMKLENHGYHYRKVDIKFSEWFDVTEISGAEPIAIDVTKTQSFLIRGNEGGSTGGKLIFEIKLGNTGLDDLKTWFKEQFLLGNFSLDSSSNGMFETILFNSSKRYEVNFDVGDYVGEKQKPKAQYVLTSDGKAIAPEDFEEDKTTYTKDNKTYTFKGWYKGEGGTGDKFDFETTITRNTTIYAKWEEESGMKLETFEFTVNAGKYIGKIEYDSSKWEISIDASASNNCYIIIKYYNQSNYIKYRVREVKDGNKITGYDYNMGSGETAFNQDYGIAPYEAVAPQSTNLSKWEAAGVIFHFEVEKVS